MSDKIKLTSGEGPAQAESGSGSAEAASPGAARHEDQFKGPFIAFCSGDLEDGPEACLLSVLPDYGACEERARQADEATDGEYTYKFVPYKMALNSDAMARALNAILALAFKHEVQSWLDAPGTDAEKLAKITGLARSALSEASR